MLKKSITPLLNDIFVPILTIMFFLMLRVLQGSNSLLKDTDGLLIIKQTVYNILIHAKVI